MNILLIGPRASGKTTIGRALAQRLNRLFVDLDERVLASFAQRSIVEVWENCGEQAWRTAEIRCLRETLKLSDQVMALGGGVVMIPAAHELIEDAQRNTRATVAYLQCSATTLIQRLKNDPGDRPRLSNVPFETEVEQTLDVREPRYLALADMIVNADQPVDEVTNSLIATLGKRVG